MLRRLLAVAVVAVVAVVVGAACAEGGDASAGRRPSPATGHATVVAVTDGDTVRVEIGGREERVRLIGIDTPETHGPGGLRECFGREASHRAEELLPRGSSVRLVRDAEARDRHGRLLAYVYLDDGTFVNLVLAREGFAAPLSVPPNITHQDELVGAAAEARESRRGLWGRCGGPDTPVRRVAPLPSPP